MTNKEAIKRELLEAAGDPAALEAVFQRRSHSKWPLYAALDQATAELKLGLPRAQQELTETKARQKALQGEVGSLDGRREELCRLNRVQEERLSRGETRLAQVQGLLDEAHELDKLGFGAEQLARIREILLEAAVRQGSGEKEAVGLFFKRAGQYRDVVSLEVEAKGAEVTAERAKAEAARWQAEAQAAEARCKARKASIDVTEKLLAQGVKEPDLPRWAEILGKAGVAPEELAKGLEEYGSIESLLRARQKRAEEFERRAGTSESRVKALAREQEETHAAIKSVKEAALAEVLQAGQGVAASLKELEARVSTFGNLKEELGDMKAEVVLARALRSPDPDVWKTVAPQRVVILLHAALTWARATGFNPSLEPPEYIQRANSLSSWNRVRFVDLVRWAMATVVGLAEGEERVLAVERVITRPKTQQIDGVTPAA